MNPPINLGECVNDFKKRNRGIIPLGEYKKKSALPCHGRESMKAWLYISHLFPCNPTSCINPLGGASLPHPFTVYSKTSHLWACQTTFKLPDIVQLRSLPGAASLWSHYLVLKEYFIVTVLKPISYWLYGIHSTLRFSVFHLHAIPLSLQPL